MRNNKNYKIYAAKFRVYLYHFVKALWFYFFKMANFGFSCCTVRAVDSMLQTCHFLMIMFLLALYIQYSNNGYSIGIRHSGVSETLRFK